MTSRRNSRAAVASSAASCAVRCSAASDRSICVAIGSFRSCFKDAPLGLQVGLFGNDSRRSCASCEINAATPARGFRQQRALQIATTSDAGMVPHAAMVVHGTDRTVAGLAWHGLFWSVPSPRGRSGAPSDRGWVGPENAHGSASPNCGRAICIKPESFDYRDFSGRHRQKCRCADRHRSGRGTRGRRPEGHDFPRQRRPFRRGPPITHTSSPRSANSRAGLRDNRSSVLDMPTDPGASRHGRGPLPSRFACRQRFGLSPAGTLSCGTGHSGR